MGQLSVDRADVSRCYDLDVMRVLCLRCLVSAVFGRTRERSKSDRIGSYGVFVPE